MTATHIRILRASDSSLLDVFLSRHRDSSMFLRGNAYRAGLEYHGKPFQAVYAGAFYDGELVGVAAHCWNGMMLVQAPMHVREIVQATIAWSGRRVLALAGPHLQVSQARDALGLRTAPAALDESEWLYALDLSHLLVPDALTRGDIQCRPPLADEYNLLHDWRVLYDREALRTSDSEEQRRNSAEFLNSQLADADTRVAVVASSPVSFSGYNASLPDIVQLGGIFTPREMRGRGYAQAAVAASLIAARERGVSRAVLFTKNESAVRAYEALGFRHAGDYALVLFS